MKRDLKIRYKDSVLGFFWSLCRPLFLLVIVSAVFSLIFPRFDIPCDVPYPLFLITGLLPWIFFSGTLAESSGLLLANAPLIKKVSLNSAVFSAAAVASNLIHLVLAFVVYVGFLVYYHVVPGTAIVLVIPALLIQSLFLLSLVLLASSLNVFYRDVSSIVELVLTGWFYVTPILYPINMVADRLLEKFPTYGNFFMGLYLLNPVAPVSALYRRAFLFGCGEKEISDLSLATWSGASLLVSMITFWIAWRVFQRLRPKFADQL